MKLNIAQKIWGASIACAVLLLVMFGISTWSAAKLAEGADRIARAPEVIATAAAVDMRHDAVRASVVLATSSDDPSALEEQLSSVAGDVEEMTRGVDEVVASGTSDAIARAAEAQRADIEEYGKRAAFAISAAGSSSEAEALAAFEEQFTKLEGSLPSVSEAVTAWTEDVLREENAQQALGRNIGIGVIVVALLALVGGSFVVVRLIAGPIRKAAAVLDEVARGNLGERLDHDGADEIGQMAVALNTALENLSTAIVEIGSHAGSLAGASEELTAVSSQLASTAEETSAQVSLVASAADQVSENVATVASGTGEMNVSIQEISHSAHDAVQVANEAVRVAETTNETVAKLGASSAEIGSVIKVISTIAEQTNLLALNATIEAARAGEAGKGFAVVAHEVKELANATSAATADISQRISAIQTDAAAAVSAISEITEIIGRVGETQSSIASAVEEQTATTTEIGRNVSEASQGSNEIAQNIGVVASAANDASVGAGHTRDTATELSRMAGELQELVGSFRC